MALLEDHINKAPLMLSVLSQGNRVMKNKNFHGTVHSYNMVFVSFNHVKFCYSGGWFLIILFCKCSIRYFDIVRIKASWFMNHKSISWSHKPKICKTYIFHISLFPKYGNFKIISAGDICLSICLELNEWDCSIREKKFHPMFWFVLNYVVMH